MKIHHLAEVQSKHIGEDTTVCQFVVILPGAVIGNNCIIHCNTFIENDVVIGNNVTVNAGSNLWNAIRLEDDVFLGSHVCFATDPTPRSKKRISFPLTTVKKGASLGSNTVVLPGITIGRYAIIEAGSLITKDVPDYAFMAGDPALRESWVDETGKKLVQREGGIWFSETGSRFKEIGNTIIKIQDSA
jgi:UDP-2-acetamido-3-amino-2,3-dideoxy-glucuronate N-acetyltransferase